MNKNIRYLLAFIAVLSITILKAPLVLAQTVKTVAGKVYEGQSNELLTGVSVKIKNTATAVITGADGSYSIKAKETDVLVFSYVGYTPLEIAVAKRTTINATLKNDSKALNDVIVVGYGQVKKADLTGSVGVLNVAETIEKAPVMSLDQALAGRIAGVQVSSGSGQPGNEGINIVIRGAGSLTQSNSPLYVVDGFPNEYFDASSLNINDIESINVLKDASAIAIYGARGSNGVIIVETKKGKVGAPIITYNGSLGYQQMWQRMDLMGPYEFVKYEIERGFGARYLNNGRTLESYKDIKGVDWQDQLFKTGSSGIHNFAVRGGTEQTRYSVSGSVITNDAVIINTGTNRYQGRMSLDQTISKKIKAGINVNYSSQGLFGTNAAVTNRNEAAVSSYLLYNTLGYRPVTGRVDFTEDDLENNLIDLDIDGLNDYRVNPILSAKNEYNKTWNKNLLGNAYAEYQVINGLTFKATGSINLTNSNREYFYNSNTSQGNPLNPAGRGQWGGKANTQRFTWSNENTLTYKKRINKNNNYDVMVGYSTQKSAAKADGFISINTGNELLGVNGLGAGTPYSVNTSASENTQQSFLGRANYNYKSKYLLTATFRADGSSKFPKDGRWGYFPSGAAAWRISGENFMKKIKFVNDAKLRLSYGLTGNNRVDDYASVDLLSQNTNASYSWNNGSPTLGTYIFRLGNSDLKWETSEQMDIGLDLAFFKNRLVFSGDVYRKNTKDLLLNADMPSHTGFATVYKNIGSIRNDGLELTLNSINIKNKNFSWETNFNISFNKNTVTDLNEGQINKLETIQWNQSYVSTPLYITEVGQPAGQFFGFIWEGNYQYNDFNETSPGVYVLKGEIPTNGNTRASIKPGDIKYRDLNGDGVVDDADRTVIGRGTPIHTGGFSNSFNYKGFNLGVFFQWSYGNDLINANRLMFEGTSMNSLNQFATYENRWTPENQNNEYFRTNGYGPAGRYSTRVIEDGSYLKLKTLSFGYDIPSKYLSKYKIKNLGFTVAAQNLITWTNYSGFDPEVSTKNSVLTPGFDYSAYPHARTVVFGLKLTL